MPRRKQNKKTRKPSRRRPKWRSTIQRSPIVSNSQVAKLRYVERITLNAGVATIAYDTFSATSCYDPYVAAGGHQPLGFDEWMNFYEHYMVLGSKITAIGSNYTTGVNQDVYLVAKLKPDSGATTTNIATIMEQGGASYRLLTSRDGNRSSAVVKCYYSPKKFFSLKNPRDEQDLRGIATSNPTENAYFQISAVGSTSASDPPPIEVLCTLEYTVLFTERKPLQQS